MEKQSTLEVVTRGIVSGQGPLPQIVYDMHLSKLQEANFSNRKPNRERTFQQYVPNQSAEPH